MAKKSPGLRAIRRTESNVSPEFDLAYTRTGPRGGGLPVVVLPGGPGLASVLPYRRFRARAATLGIDTIMVEHRGIGLSRNDIAGNPLPTAAIKIAAVVDDIAAVLDAEEVSGAVVYGSSYGSYLASGFGIVHPSRVAGMVLDSVVLSAHDHHLVRSHARSLLWSGDVPELADCARLLRGLVASGTDHDEASDVARIVYEFGGGRLLARVLAQATAGRAKRTWKFIAGVGPSEINDEIASAYVMELGAVGRIAFTELNYAPPPDGKPFDPATQFAAAAQKYPHFAGEPFDIPARMPHFEWPTAIITGTRDLRTPSPVAARAASLLPHVHTISLDNGHSALDTHQLAALHVIERMTTRDSARLTTRDDETFLSTLPYRGSPTRLLPHIITTKLLLDRIAARASRRLIP